MISIVPEEFNLIKLKIYYINGSDKHIDLHVKFPEETDCAQRAVCLSNMEAFIDLHLKTGDIPGLFDACKKFMLENQFKYYEVYKIG